MQHPSLFDDTETAFSVKSDSELQRAYLLFRILSVRLLVKIGTAATRLAIALRLPIEWIIRATVFDHFCGGIDQKDCLPVIDTIYKKGVTSILDFSVEGKKSDRDFDASAKMISDLIDFSKRTEGIPMVVFKPTSFGCIQLYEKVGAGTPLTAEEHNEWARITNRFDAVCKKAAQCDVMVLIDAEESWMQDAADGIATEMMKRYNTKKATVYNTLQMYRHDRFDFLKRAHKTAKEERYILAFKVVRGAYMEKERQRALEKKCPSPICKNKAATDANFNKALNYILDNLNTIALFSGTHNEESSLMLTALMAQKNLKNSDPRVWSGQLYGMSDHITFNLANKGYNASKYLPFGPVKEVIPYLMRRARENTSIAGQTTRELALLKREKRRRRGSNL